jgi:hypothetical protein
MSSIAWSRRKSITNVAAVFDMFPRRIAERDGAAGISF